LCLKERRQQIVKNWLAKVHDKDLSTQHPSAIVPTATTVAAHHITKEHTAYHNSERKLTDSVLTIALQQRADFVPA
jgi:hypothetical protein